MYLKKLYIAICFCKQRIARKCPASCKKTGYDHEGWKSRIPRKLYQ
jgi:hypothetical protein